MPDQNTLLYITGAVFGLALFFFLISLRLFRRSRRDVFWRRRREAGQRGWRLLLFSIFLLVVSGLCCGITGVTYLMQEEDTPVTTTVAELSPTASEAPLTAIEQSPTPTAFETSMPPVDSPSPVPTVVVIVTATFQQTPTETPFATFTPYTTPPVSSVTPEPGARITITALDDQISDALTPIDPRSVFDPGTTRIYLFVRFRTMTPGVLWKRYLYRDGERVDGGDYLWGSETSGESYFFFGSDSGFPPGGYEVRLFIGDSETPVSVMPFQITGSP